MQRSIAQDPIGFRGGDADLYTYVHNNPVNLRDPNGKGPIGAAASRDRMPWLHYLQPLFEPVGTQATRRDAKPTNAVSRTFLSRRVTKARIRRNGKSFKKKSSKSSRSSRT